MAGRRGHTLQADAGDRDKTLSCSCLVSKRKNFVSRARTTPLRSVAPSAWRLPRPRGRSASGPVERPRRTSGGPTTGQAPPPSRTLSPNWTVDRSAVERHRLLRMERRPGSYPVLTLILRSRQSPAPSTAPDLLQIVTPVAIFFLFL